MNSTADTVIIIATAAVILAVLGVIGLAVYLVVEILD